MQGLFKRKGSEVWQGRFRVPSDLWKQRGRLAEVGVKDLPKVQEHGRSTGNADRDDAGNAYRAMLVAWDAKMAAWRKLLADGPQSLSHKQRVAIAADHARAFLAAHEDNPSEAPAPAPPMEPSDDDSAWRAAIGSMAPDERRALAADLRAFLQTKDERQRSSRAFRLLEVYPSLRSAIGPELATMLEAEHGADTDAALRAKGLHVDAQTRRLINLEMAGLMGAARRGLQAMQGGDYSPVRALEVAPAYVPTPAPKAADKADPKFTFKAIVEAETVRRAQGRDAKPFPERTPKKYAKAGEEFAAWRRGQGLSKGAAADAGTVTLEEAERWRATMLETAELGNRTINGKVDSISTIIKWGQGLYRHAFHPNGNPLAKLRKLGFKTVDSDARTYRLEEAVTVLEAARKETEVRRRWLPWLCAYTGMRIEEAGQLEAGDFFQAGGRWFLRVSTTGRRSLKTASSQRRIPIHPSLEAEGLLEFVGKVDKGPLFLSNRVQPLMSEWVRETVGITRPELSPNHGWRHFFEDLCVLANMPDAARDYITGRASGKSRDLYGGSDLRLPGLAEAMDKVPDILEIAQRHKS